MIDAEDRIVDLNIENAMKKAYIDYSMSVIVSRALPDVRDGLKPSRTSGNARETITDIE